MRPLQPRSERVAKGMEHDVRGDLLPGTFGLSPYGICPLRLPSSSTDRIGRVFRRIERIMHILGRSRRKLLPIALILLAGTLAFAAPQIGGGSCSTSMVNGTYFYTLAGTVQFGGAEAPYAELGELVADGSGDVSGTSFRNLNGQRNTYPLVGTYSIQSNCGGSITLTVNSQTISALTFQVINNAQAMILAISNNGEVVTGRAYRTTAGSGSPQCSNGSLSGTYGYVLTGFATESGGSYLYSDSGQVTADGNGNLTATSVANFGGTFSNVTGTGTYSVTGQCYGTASVTTENATSNYVFAIVQDGQEVLFLETDAGTTVGGTGQPQFTAPQQAVVNGASFQPLMVAAGSLFSIFGTGLSASTATAETLPLPTTLGQIQVLVNGTSAPLVYVSGGQINAQMPVNVPTGQPVTLTVTNGGTTSNTVTLNVPPAAPGIFTVNGAQAVVQNPNGSINSSTSPAHPGDVLTAYLTGGGAVNSAAWTTGAASPAGAASVTVSYALTVGGQPAQVQYLGLTPGFVGLYQANFTVPSLAAGQYPIVVTMAGNTSNAATVTVGG